MIVFLALTSNMFGAVFARLGTATVVTDTLLAAPGAALPDAARA